MRDFGGNAPLIVGVLVALLVVVNIIITAIILGRPMTPNINVNSSPQGQQQAPPPPPPASSGMSTAGGKAKERVFVLQYGHDYGLYEYIDNGGYHRGFFLNLTVEVCKAGGIKCKLVYDKYPNCWEGQPGSHPILGTGLQARYYDGCIGWFPTIERIHTASFTLPFLTDDPATFFYKKGTSPNLNDFSAHKVGFVEGWAASETCVARELATRTGIPLKKDQIRHYVDTATLAAAVNSGEVTLGFGGVVEFGSYLTQHGLEASPDYRAKCTLAGNGVLCRADSDLPDAWNKGFIKIFSNGKFAQLCKEAAVEHADRGNINCIDSFSYDKQ